ncbi:hypothetical protein K502DRAFT_351206 [Neoconidiobolus thromboides FSU 785]|nr:hypothetical protein K502DRAFT_351206 [Neoconidiobolus thromboides FSU 785]
MTHVSTDTFTLEELLYCPNIKSFEFFDLVIDSEDSSLYDSVVSIPLSRSKKTIETDSIHIKEAVKHLNPNDLRSFILFSEGSLNIDEANVIKTSFKKLKGLRLKYDTVAMSHGMFKSNTKFESSLEL